MAFLGAHPYVRAPKYFSSGFFSTQAPIVDDGGYVVSTNWTQPQTINGRITNKMDTYDGAHFTDSITHRRGFTTNHYIKTTFYNNSAPSGLEVEHLLNFTIDTVALTAAGYEVDVVNSASEINLVSWRGPGGFNTASQGEGITFDTMASGFTTGLSMADGDILESQINNGVIDVWCTPISTGIRAHVITAFDAWGWAVAHSQPQWTGNPGLGFWNQLNTANTTFGFKNVVMLDI